MSNLEIIQALETYMGHSLKDETVDRILDYLYDDPMDTSPEYLQELFELTNRSWYKALYS